MRWSTSPRRGAWPRNEKNDGINALLAPIYRWFTEGFGTPLLQEAKRFWTS